MLFHILCINILQSLWIKRENRKKLVTLHENIAGVDKMHSNAVNIQIA